MRFSVATAVNSSLMPRRCHGHTLASVISEMEALFGNTIERILADKGYRGLNGPADYKFMVFMSGQKRRVTLKIKRELLTAVRSRTSYRSPKAEHRMDRNYLTHRAGTPQTPFSLPQATISGS
jgi:transposase, IS5 family